MPVVKVETKVDTIRGWQVLIVAILTFGLCHERLYRHDFSCGQRLSLSHM